MGTLCLVWAQSPGSPLLTALPRQQPCLPVPKSSLTQCVPLGLQILVSLSRTHFHLQVLLSVKLPTTPTSRMGCVPHLHMPVVLGYCWNTVHTVGELLVFPSFVRHESTILSKERLPLPYVPVPGGREVVVVLVTGTWVKIQSLWSPS